MSELLDLIKKKRVYFDGATGTILQREGLKPGENPEEWNLHKPDKIIALHEGYLKAGSNIILANTFGANPIKFPENYEEVIQAAMKLGRKAIENVGEPEKFLALDIGSCGKLLEPIGDLPFEDAIELFSKIVRAGAPSADVIVIETMNDSYETKAAVIAAKENSDLPVFVTNVYDENSLTMTGSSPEVMTAMLEGLGVDALGMNCSLGPKQMVDIVPRFAKVSTTPIIVNPNAGLPSTDENGNTVYDVGPDEFAECMKKIAEAGATILGGCCGTDTEYIRKEIEETKDVPFVYPSKKNISVITSSQKAVYFGGKTVLIGERINPTGKKRFKQALRDHDMDYIIDEAMKQQEAGAEVLDVNVGLPEIDEDKMMQETVSELMSITDLPLQIDTGDAAAMEHALRMYNGKAMVNSVNAKDEVMDKIFPLVKKYGGFVVGLTIGENGVPKTADERVALAKHIYEKAEEYGISKNDIIIDPLAMTISADDQAGVATLDSVKRIHDELHGLTSLGISNVSFGLPDRMYLTSIFFTMAMEDGLSAAIMNPFAKEMMNAYFSFNALKGRDKMCMDYLSNAEKKEAEKENSINEKSTEKIKGAVSELVAALSEAGISGINISGGAVGGGNNAGGTGKSAAGGIGNNAGGSDKENASAGDSAVSGNGKFEDLQNAIIKGLSNKAKTFTENYIKNGTDSLDIVNGAVIPALNVVGDGFEKKTLFLPNLLMAAEAAQASFAVIKDDMAKHGSSTKGPKIIMATVKGDVHDMGKNIVKVILENYGYDVIDLGKDVAPAKVVECAKENDVKLVGLSALMTTTVPSMEETIKQLHEQSPDTKIMVGGAVMNEDYAKMIHADFYTKDAMASVAVAQEVFG